MTDIFTGTFLATAKGYGFVSTGTPPDIFIPEDFTNGALHLDTVECVLRRGSSSTRPDGEIVKLVSRGIPSIAGTFCAEKKGGYLTSLEPKIPYAFDIAPIAVKRLGLVDGHRVMFNVSLKGQVQITEIFGHKNDIGMDVLSMVRQSGVPYEFPQEVINEANALPDTVTDADTEGRVDYRHLHIITIDGADTKDIDDAISLTKLPNSNFELGVHIADVSHYVRPGSAIDLEARKRGTSIYLADRVIPMLPHKLSNGICSLNPHVDRLAMSCVMEINGQGDVVKHKLAPSVIHSKMRCTYDEVAQKTDEFADMYKLAEILNKKRIARGALNLNVKEGKAIVDESGFPLDIQLREANAATSLIEEFMIVCNETIAERSKNKPFVFRTHEEPEPDKMIQIQKDLERLAAQPAVSTLILRNLKQAKYTMENIGHFGLASECYCHFTSPIRRYPDLLVHRSLKDGLKKRGLADLCLHCSWTERNAETLERDVLQLKKVQFMADKVGQVFDGMVSSVVDWGIFVQLPNTVEGLVPAEFLTEEFRLGDAIKVALVKADVEERKLTFAPRKTV